MSELLDIKQFGDYTYNNFNHLKSVFIKSPESYETQLEYFITACNYVSISSSSNSSSSIIPINYNKFNNIIYNLFNEDPQRLDQTIFKAQPGLARRCTNIVEIKGYTPLGLARILESQLIKSNWKLHSEVTPQKLEEMFKSSPELFKDSGGATEKLSYYAKLAYGKFKFEEAVQNPDQNVQDSQITLEMFEHALEMIRQNSVAPKPPSPPPDGMFI